MQQQQQTQKQRGDIPFHYLEDIPGEDDALELYYQSREVLENPRQQADTLMSEIVHRTTQVKLELDGLIQQVDANKSPGLIIAFQEIVANTRENYEATRNMASIIEKMGAVDSHAIGIIDAQRETIDQLTGEIEDLLTQINDGNTIDERFEPLMSAARRMIETDTKLVAMVTAEFDLIDKICHYVRHLGAKPDIAYQMASRLFYLIQGLLDDETPGVPVTESEKSAFIDLLNVLVIPE